MGVGVEAGEGVGDVAELHGCGKSGAAEQPA